MTRILLVEDHSLVRSGIRSLFEKDPSITVAEEAINGREALDKLSSGLDVSLIITDIGMSEMTGIELAGHVSKRFPHIKTLILSMYDHESYLQEAFRNGASAYVLKSASYDELSFAVRHVMAGNTYICSRLSYGLLKRSANLFINDPDYKKVELSARELEILKMVAAGMTNSDIADKLFTSRRTVEGHRHKLLQKTGTNNTAALIRYAIQYELLEP